MRPILCSQPGCHGPGRGEDEAPQRSGQRDARCCDLMAGARFVTRGKQPCAHASAIGIGSVSVSVAFPVARQPAAAETSRLTLVIRSGGSFHRLMVRYLVRLMLVDIGHRVAVNYFYTITSGNCDAGFPDPPICDAQLRRDVQPRRGRRTLSGVPSV